MRPSRISRSHWLKALVMLPAVAAFIWLYEETVPDSHFSLLPPGFQTPLDTSAPPKPGVPQAFSVTAYCKGFLTSAGVAAQWGVAAADPSLLPIGSVIELTMGDSDYDGIYTVLDTGPQIRGRDVDIYMWSCNDALRFGRKPARVNVLRLGWNPRATTPTFFNRLFKRNTPAKTPPVRPGPAGPQSPAPQPQVEQPTAPSASPEAPAPPSASPRVEPLVPGPSPQPPAPSPQ